MQLCRLYCGRHFLDMQCLEYHFTKLYNHHICAYFLYLDLAWKRKSKKRKLLIDPVKEISSKIMHKQLTSFADTLMVLELAPPTQRLMMWKKRGGVDTLLSNATQDLIHTELKMVIVSILLHGCNIWL